MYEHTILVSAFWFNIRYSVMTARVCDAICANYMLYFICGKYVSDPIELIEISCYKYFYSIKYSDHITNLTLQLSSQSSMFDFL